MKYIIDFINSATEQDIQSYLASNSATIVQQLNYFKKSFIVDAPTTPNEDSVVEHIIDDHANPINLLEYTQIFTHFDNEPTTTISINDDDNWWKVAVIRAPDYSSDDNTHTIRGDKVNVYILDSGIEASHPEFVDTTITNIFSITGEYGDTRGHGTALASVIAGKTCGLTNSSICVVKIFDATVSTYQSDMLAAMDAVLSDYNAKGRPPSVVNLSWSISKNIYIESKIQHMINEGMFVVCSAGNSGIPIENVTPASMEAVITVGSFNSFLEPSNFSDFSNQPISLTTGAVNTGQLDGWGPGENIKIATLGGLYNYASGTSISSAIHAGALAYDTIEFLDGDDLIPACISSGDTVYNMAWISTKAFSKKNLLDLGEKYKDSVNKITTYSTTTGSQLFNAGAGLQLKAGTSVCKRLFSCPIKEITFSNADQLPYNLRIEKSFLFGDIPEIQSVAAMHELFGQATLLSGEVKPFTLMLGIYNSSIDISTEVPGTDPVLDIILQVSQCCGPLNSTCQVTTDMCDDVICTGPGVCEANKAGTLCECGGI